MTSLFTNRSNSVKRGLTGTLLTLGLLLAGGSQALAGTIKATLTADNHYGLYHAQENGSGLTFVGRNEFGPTGNPGGLNWSLPETWTFDINPADYLYVVVWDDAAVAESWIGEFELPGGVSLLSDTTNWEYIIASGQNPGDYGNVPQLTELVPEIANANWTATRAVGPNGTSPWGVIPGISTSAQFLNVSNPRSANYTIFRTKAAVEVESVPEPSAALTLMAFGASGAGSLLKRKQQQKAMNFSRS